MKTLHELTKDDTPERRRKETEDQAAALGGLEENGPAWQTLRARFERMIAEANDMGTLPEQPQREFYAGGERLLRDLWQELDDLRSGAWEEWPEFAQPRRKKEEEQSEEWE